MRETNVKTNESQWKTFDLRGTTEVFYEICLIVDSAAFETLQMTETGIDADDSNQSLDRLLGDDTKMVEKFQT
jgi:hypothetical protein